MTNPDPRLQVWDRPADRLRAQLEADVDRIRSNPALNADARLAFMAERYVQAVDQMARLQDGSGENAAAAAAAAKRAVFGIDDLLASGSAGDRATVQLSFRDAQARAAQIESDQDALALLQSATDTGDELLARAIGNAALVPTGFGPLFPQAAQQYLADRPAKAQAYERMTEATSASMNTADMWEFVLPKPPELNMFNDSAIAAEAAKAGTYRAAV